MDPRPLGNKFSATAVVKDRAIIVKYVPANHSPDALAEQRIIKRNQDYLKVR
jgi:hypothetical protein